MSGQQFRSINKISNWTIGWSSASIIGTIIFISSYGPRFAILYYAIEIIAAIISLCWFYRANKNIHAFGAKEVISPRMAVIWFFVPILQLWKPYKVAEQIWKVSNPEITISEGTEWKNSPTSYIIKLWWVLGILSYFVVFIDVFGFLGNVLFVASAIFFIILVRQISAWQEIVGSSI
jgi:hypothetical protein